MHCKKMGNSYSGNITTGVKADNITFSGSGGGPNFTISNASGNQLRVFYHKNEIKLEDLVEKKDPATSKRFFKPATGMTYVDLPQRSLLVVSTLNQAFASIFITDKKNTKVYVETISLNFKISDGKSFIVTAENEIKFRKPNGGVWIDEDGNNHYSL